MTFTAEGCARGSASACAQREGADHRVPARGVHRGDEGAGLHHPGSADGAASTSSFSCTSSSRFGYNVELLPSCGPRRGRRGPQVREQRHLLPVHPGHRPDYGSRHDRGATTPTSLPCIITQTGGGCRATNYISLIRKALKAVGLAHIPVIAHLVQGLRRAATPGFKITPKMLLQAVYALQLRRRAHDSVSTARAPTRWSPVARTACSTTGWPRARASSESGELVRPLQAHDAPDRRGLRHAAAPG